MIKPTFKKLCDKICDAVGENVFRPECNCPSGFIPGEIKCGISIRILAGGSYLDLIGREYGLIQPGSVYNIFHQFTGWVQQTF